MNEIEELVAAEETGARQREAAAESAALQELNAQCAIQMGYSAASVGVSSYIVPRIVDRCVPVNNGLNI